VIFHAENSERQSTEISRICLIALNTFQKQDIKLRSQTSVKTVNGIRKAVYLITQSSSSVFYKYFCKRFIERLKLGACISEESTAHPKVTSLTKSPNNTANKVNVYGSEKQLLLKVCDVF
jgi:hypothetical protein